MQCSTFDVAVDDMNKTHELEAGAGGRPNFWRWLALALVLIAPAASAWNDTGHMIAALIAYDQLPVEVRATAAHLVRAHPRFHEDIENRLPRSLAKAGAAAQDRWYFAFSSTWPDEARRFERAPAAARESLIARYSHSSWHYINLPTYLRASDRRRIHLDSLPMTWAPGLDASHLNIVEALDMLNRNWCIETEAERGLALIWITHLIGDLHQPLHTTAMYSVPAFEHGDRGGNDIELAGGSNLHALWDGALGSDRRLAKLDALARDAAFATATDAARQSRLDLPFDFQNWARQGRRLAAKRVYTADIRAAVAAATPPAPPRVRISAAYREAMRPIAQREIGLAGHRIAMVLQRLLGAKSKSVCSGDAVDPRRAFAMCYGTTTVCW